MIVKNEEKILKRCLDSVADLVDEIVIVDTGSADSTKQIAADEAVDLPTEFQWEYAAKSSRVEVPAENKRDKNARSPRAVKSGKRNAWGFFDMSGNVSEWCRDSYSPDGASEISAQRVSDIKIVKGGDFTTKYTLPSQRCGLHKDAKVPNVGFRVVLEKRK